MLLLSALAGGYAWSELPPYSERAYQRGETAYRIGDYGDAEKHFDSAVQAEPNNPRFRFARGCARLKQSKVLPDNRAKDKLEQAWTDFKPTNDNVMDVPTLAVKAYIKSREQNPLAAIAMYNQIADAGSRSVSVLNNRAYAFIQIKQFDKARNDLDEAASGNPDTQAIFYNRAMLAFYEQMDTLTPSSMPVQAVEDIERAIQLGPTTPALYRDAALLYAQTLWQDSVPVSLNTPIVTALHLHACEQQRERALSYLRRAITDGLAPGSIMRDHRFQQVLKSHPAFVDLHQIPSQRSTPSMELRLIDPISLPN